MNAAYPNIFDKKALEVKERGGEREKQTDRQRQRQREREKSLLHSCDRNIADEGMWYSPTKLSNRFFNYLEWLKIRWEEPAQIWEEHFILDPMWFCIDTKKCRILDAS